MLSAPAAAVPLLYIADQVVCKSREVHTHHFKDPHAFGMQQVLAICGNSQYDQ